MAYQATTGLGTPTQITVNDNTPGVTGTVVYLSLTNTTWPSTYQLEPQIKDAGGNAQAVGTALTLSAAAAAIPGPYALTAVAAAANGVAVYTGTITGGGSNAFAGRSFVVAGFAGANNNGTFQCTASTLTTLTLANTAATAETHAGTAQDQTAVAVYTGTITGGGSNAFAGASFVVAGFVTTTNNGTFYCTASSTTTLTLTNPAALAETHAGTATDQEANAITYVAYSAAQGTGQNCITVSSTGLITAAYKGAGVVEVSYPAFNNAAGAIVSSGNIMNGLPITKIYSEVNCIVFA